VWCDKKFRFLSYNFICDQKLSKITLMTSVSQSFSWKIGLNGQKLVITHIRDLFLEKSF